MKRGVTLVANVRNERVKIISRARYYHVQDRPNPTEFDHLHYPKELAKSAGGYVGEPFVEVFAGRFRSLVSPVPPGIRIKYVVHTTDQTHRQTAFYHLRTDPVAVSGPELQMISNRIARNIIRYVFHYR